MFIIWWIDMMWWFGIGLMMKSRVIVVCGVVVVKEMVGFLFRLFGCIVVLDVGWLVLVVVLWSWWIGVGVFMWVVCCCGCSESVICCFCFGWNSVLVCWCGLVVCWFSIVVWWFWDWSWSCVFMVGVVWLLLVVWLDICENCIVNCWFWFIVFWGWFMCLIIGVFVCVIVVCLCWILVCWVLLCWVWFVMLLWRWELGWLDVGCWNLLLVCVWSCLWLLCWVLWVLWCFCCDFLVVWLCVSWDCVWLLFVVVWCCCWCCCWWWFILGFIVCVYGVWLCWFWCLGCSLELGWDEWVMCVVWIWK